MINIKDQNGFTILELIIASTVFSLIMLLSTTGLIQIGKTYHKGLITSKTQETTRGVAEEISREVQFSNNSIVNAPDTTYSASASSPTVKAICVGDTRYTYVVGQPKVKLGQVDNLTDPNSPTLRHLLWTDRKSPSVGCTALNLSTLSGSALNNGRELLAQNMRLINFEVKPNGDNVSVKIKAYYGDYDLAGGVAGDGTSSCDSNKNGGQFCASSELSTVVRRRI